MARPSTIIQTINPATETVIAEYRCLNLHAVEKIIEQSHDAFLIWSKKSILERTKKILLISKILLKNCEQYAALITTEMGKPFESAKLEIEKCALICRHFAKYTVQYLAKRSVQTEMSKSYVTYEPLGIIFAIMPWNFPFWQVFRFAVPALMAGNSILLKHAPITTGCGLQIEKIFQDAGFPKNLVRVLILNNSIVPNIISHSKIMAVALTGSTKTGRIIGALSAGALKKIVLELGGNDPYIILSDADLNLAADAIIASRINNAGQSCIAAKRILAVHNIRDQIQSLILKKIKSYKFGDPMNSKNHLGPLARADLREQLNQQVQESVKQGAKILEGGFVPNCVGYYYPPTILVDVKKGMPAYDEELFGPIFTFISVQDEQEAINIANDSNFGLSAAIFTKNIKRGERIAQALHVGTVYINDFVRSDPRLPFGGIKHSGFGRELSSEGIHEFVNVKTIAIK